MSQPEARTHRCRHLFTQGHQCGSPSLREENFCYYHHTSRIPAPRPPRRTPCETEDFHLDIPEDRAALRRALGEVLRRLAAGRIDTKTAGLLLYGLQVVGCNLPPDPEPLTTPTSPRLPSSTSSWTPSTAPSPPPKTPKHPSNQARPAPPPPASATPRTSPSNRNNTTNTTKPPQKSTPEPPENEPPSTTTPCPASPNKPMDPTMKQNNPEQTPALSAFSPPKQPYHHPRLRRQFNPTHIPARISLPTRTTPMIPAFRTTRPESSLPIRAFISPGCSEFSCEDGRAVQLPQQPQPRPVATSRQPEASSD